jgi:hypothetical protein
VSASIEDLIDNAACAFAAFTLRETPELQAKYFSARKAAVDEVLGSPSEITNLRAEVADLRRQLERYRWVPVTERLPDREDQFDTTCISQGSVYITHRIYNLKLGWIGNDKVIAWREMSVPYEPPEAT